MQRAPLVAWLPSYLPFRGFQLGPTPSEHVTPLPSLLRKGRGRGWVKCQVAPAPFSGGDLASREASGMLFVGRARNASTAERPACPGMHFERDLPLRNRQPIHPGN